MRGLGLAVAVCVFAVSAEQPHVVAAVAAASAAAAAAAAAAAGRHLEAARALSSLGGGPAAAAPAAAVAELLAGREFYADAARAYGLYAAAIAGGAAGGGAAVAPGSDGGGQALDAGGLAGAMLALAALQSDGAALAAPPAAGPLDAPGALQRALGRVPSVPPALDSRAHAEWLAGCAPPPVTAPCRMRADARSQVPRGARCGGGGARVGRGCAELARGVRARLARVSDAAR